MKYQYPTLTGAMAEIHDAITVERILAAVSGDLNSLNNPGFCLDCGTEAHACEPDARHYRCESCGLRAVFGADEVLLMIA